MWLFKIKNLSLAETQGSQRKSKYRACIKLTLRSLRPCEINNCVLIWHREGDLLRTASIADDLWLFKVKDDSRGDAGIAGKKQIMGLHKTNSAITASLRDQ